eukprot:CAMPEP_0202967508 /NCGR_PEP_ID=MMETSP1396-20130829/12367_1 /ASSEMBLY_ACC=CAM_ASM_000872 /TAXON_ID= /ORGANISM="Pseudokeronopsis sp., Strain Brazil" /LENGTH=86 /DNA_ID=CAMNT_0049692589 /DNA_START=183 /DNA_END=443 /DNA_ORIENTATION=+
MFSLSDYGFDFAVKLTKPLPAKYGRIKAYHVYLTKMLDEELGIKLPYAVEEEIELEKCGDSLFNHTDKEEIEKKGIAEYFCPKNKS